MVDLQNSKEYRGEVRQAVGCVQCDYSGYEGRVLLSQTLLLDKPLKRLLREAVPDEQEFLAHCNQKNYASWNEVLASSLRSGRIDLETYFSFVSYE